MKRNLLNYIVIIFILITLGTLVYYFFINQKEEVSIEFPGDNLIISVGSSFHLNYLVNSNKNINDKIILNKSNSDVIELDSNGNIKALNKGNASITISYKNEIYDTLNIYVVDESVQTSFVVLPEIINVDENYELNIGEEKEIKYSVLPENANSYHKITSNDETIVKVINNKIIGIGVGKTEVYVESFNNIRKTINVEVKEIEIQDIIVELNLSLNVNESKVINYQINPSNATNKQVSFVSSDNNIVTVNDSGEVKGIKSGTATITIMSGKITKVINVKVVSTNNSNKNNNNNNNNSNNSNKNNNSAVTTSTCNSNDPEDTAFASCFKRSHGLVLSSSSISIKAGSSGSVTVKLPSECGTNMGYTRKSADGESGWSNFVSQSRSNETSTGFTWIINANANAKGKTIILSQTIQYNAKSKGGCTGNVKSMARLTVTIT